MAFLLARPTSTTKPICVKMLTSMLATITPDTEQSRHIGTTRITASGSDQLSYWAASTRKTNITARKKTNMAVLPACKLQIGQLGPVVGHRVGQLLVGDLCIMSMAWPELVPGLVLPVMAVAEYML